jgi:hypothetical protein
MLFISLIYFKGEKLLTNRGFAAYKQFKDKNMKLKQQIRALFFYSIPLFLLAVAATPRLWCDNCMIARLLTAFLVLGSITLVMIILRVNGDSAAAEDWHTAEMDRLDREATEKKPMAKDGNNGTKTPKPESGSVL